MDSTGSERELIAQITSSDIGDIDIVVDDDDVAAEIGAGTALAGDHRRLFARGRDSAG